MFFDTHAHIFRQYYDDVDQALLQAKNEQISKIIMVGFDVESSHESVALTSQPGVYAAVGIHPHSAAICCQNACNELKTLSRQQGVVAIGEIGLDYHYQPLDKTAQKNAMIMQIKLANEVGLPVIFHMRDAAFDMLEILRENPVKNGGVFHCFSGSAEYAREVLRLGFYISFSGSVTFKNARGLVDAALAVPSDRLLIETDSPYLAPTPHRGQQNFPHYVKLVAQRLAEIRGTTIEDIAALTMANAHALFGV